MVGVGVGFDTKGAGKIVSIEPEGSPELLVIEDSREGWVEALSCLIDSYLDEGSAPMEFDYSLIREYGEPIRGFGGVASGPEPYNMVCQELEIFLLKELNLMIL